MEPFDFGEPRALRHVRHSEAEHAAQSAVPGLPQPKSPPAWRPNVPGAGLEPSQTKARGGGVSVTYQMVLERRSTRGITADKAAGTCYGAGSFVFGIGAVEGLNFL